MSMNVVFEAVGRLYNPVTKRHEKIEQNIPVWQTPTKVSYKIARSPDPVSAYVDWVRGLSHSHFEHHDYDPETREYKKTSVNLNEEHIAQFLAAVNDYRQRGFQIECYVV